MNPPSDPQKLPKESFARALISRLMGVVAVLSLWHIPDLWAAAIYLVGTVVFYYPHPAAVNAVPPAWLRAVWFVVVGAVIAGFFMVETPAPPGSVAPPAAKYGLLAIVMVQMLYDFVRREQTQRKEVEKATERELETRNDGM